MRTVIPLLALTVALAGTGDAHQQPTTLVVLNMGSDQATANLHVPLTELELAFGHDVSKRPEETIGAWAPALKNYLVAHIRPVTPAGEPWFVQVQRMNVERAEQTQSGPFQEVLVELSLTPPAGGTVRKFILNYDLILHQVVTHKALVSVHRDWTSGRTGPE